MPMFYWSALVLGLLGSLHCLGMCGPIVLVLPGTLSARVRFASSRLLYTAGKAATYAVMGFVAGLLGQGMAFAGLQRPLGIVAGAVMILSVVIPARLSSRLGASSWIAAPVAGLRIRLSALLTSDTLPALFSIGLLNGFLPCGLVYTALAASLVAGSAPAGAGYMFLFGIGTAPMLIAIAFAGSLIALPVRRRLARLLPVGVVTLGLLFILRNLSLGIPYLSPDMQRVTRAVAPHTHDSSVAVRDSIPGPHNCCK